MIRIMTLAAVGKPITFPIVQVPIECRIHAIIILC